MKPTTDTPKTPAPPTARRPIVSYAQNSEDVLLNRVFSDIDDGFYVDIGAFDPVRGSVTKLFYDRGWSGINIEPGTVFERLAAERPRDINLNIAVLDRPGEVTFVEVDDDAATSFVNDVAKPDASAALVGKSRVVTCDSLEHIIDKHAADRPINFLKIDAEGSEAPIINSVDWKRIRPQIILVEATISWTTELISESWEPTLLANGYTRAYFDGLNLFFVRNEDADQLKHFAIPVNVLDDFDKHDPEKIATAERLESVWQQSAELVHARDLLFAERAATIEQANHANKDMNDRLTELRKQNAELVHARDLLFAERAAAIEQANHANQELNDRLTELRKQNAELVSIRDRLSAENTANIEQAHRANLESASQLTALWKENARLVEARDAILAERGTIVLDLNFCRRALAEMEQANHDLRASLRQALEANTDLRSLCDETAGEPARLRSEFNSTITELERRLANQSCEDVRQDAERYHRLVHSLQAPDGPRALRAALPIARLIRAGRRAIMKKDDLAVMPPNNTSVEMQLHSSVEPVPAKNRNQIVKSMLRPITWLIYPIARPLAFRIRRYLLSPLDPILQQMKSRSDPHSDLLASQSQQIQLQMRQLEVQSQQISQQLVSHAELMNGIWHQTQSLSQQITAVQSSVSSLAALQSETPAELDQRLTYVAENFSPDLIKNIDGLILSLAATATESSRNSS